MMYCDTAAGRITEVGTFYNDSFLSVGGLWCRMEVYLKCDGDWIKKWFAGKQIAESPGFDFQRDLMTPPSLVSCFR